LESTVVCRFTELSKLTVCEVILYIHKQETKKSPEQIANDQFLISLLTGRGDDTRWQYVYSDR